ncbi:glycosyltransferase family A protein [Georgenia faecalis]|uniref:Glycosyltransferase family A protein n=1 Tax=Georgenia faecalis TaxID=2483799 RepID=A0ABV9DBD0_9MICO|nr:glycosyltransferase family A protein [Georgenia faecalis]
MTAPVDVVIAVHNAERPIGRAVASVLDGNGEDVLLTVVCHGLPAADIRARLDPAHRSRVRFLEHDDGIPSPAGPFNAGMRAAEGRYVSIMGSDDWLEPGAVASWLTTARRTGAETVITRLALGRPGNPVRTPPARPWCRGLLDPVRDRLSYRSAPLGLVSTAARRRLDAELVPGLVVGDDVPYVTRLWFETAVAYDRTGPGYVVGEDATDRVTFSPRPITVELAFVRHLLGEGWFADYPEQWRRAVCTKITRIHLFGAVYNRPDPAFWTEAERAALAGVARALGEAAPGYEQVLSLADRDLLRAIRQRRFTAEEMIAAAHARRRHGTPRTVLTADPCRLLAVEGPLRLMVASALVR